MRKNILVLTTSLDMGGITSFTVNLVNQLSCRHRVTLAYTCDNANRLGDIPPDVVTIPYSIPSTRAVLLEMAQRGWIGHALRIKLRKHHQVSPIPSIQRFSYAMASKTELPRELSGQFDVAISTAEFFCNNLVMKKIAADTRVAWIHPDYQAMHADVAFDRITLDTADWIAVVSEQNRQTLSRIIPDYRDKVLYVPNLLDVRRIRERANSMPEEYQDMTDRNIFVTVCRLDNSSKRLDRAVKICRVLKARGDRFHWFIVGDGPDRKRIAEEICQNDVADCMTLLGGRENPYPYMAYADLFVLTSQYEGKPVVIDEALALGCPVAVTEYGSAREQVGPQQGWILPNDDEACIKEFLKAFKGSKPCRIPPETDERNRIMFWQATDRILGISES